MYSLLSPAFNNLNDAAAAKKTAVPGAQAAVPKDANARFQEDQLIEKAMLADNFIEHGLLKVDKSVSVFGEIINLTEGRDKLFKIFAGLLKITQYFVANSASLTQARKDDIIGRIITANTATSTARGFLKLFTDWTFFRMAIRVYYKQRSGLLKILSLGRLIGLALYFTFQTPVWLHTTRLDPSIDRAFWSKLSLKTYIFSTICQIMMDIQKLRGLIHDIGFISIFTSKEREKHSCSTNLRANEAKKLGFFSLLFSRSRKSHPPAPTNSSSQSSLTIPAQPSNTMRRSPTSPEAILTNSEPMETVNATVNASKSSDATDMTRHSGTSTAEAANVKATTEAGNPALPLGGMTLNAAAAPATTTLTSDAIIQPEPFSPMVTGMTTGTVGMLTTQTSQLQPSALRRYMTAINLHQLQKEQQLLQTVENPGGPQSPPVNPIQMTPNFRGMSRNFSNSAFPNRLNSHRPGYGKGSTVLSALNQSNSMSHHVSNKDQIEGSSADNQNESQVVGSDGKTQQTETNKPDRGEVSNETSGISADGSKKSDSNTQTGKNDDFSFLSTTLPHPFSFTLPSDVNEMSPRSSSPYTSLSTSSFHPNNLVDNFDEQGDTFDKSSFKNHGQMPTVFTLEDTNKHFALPSSISPVSSGKKSKRHSGKRNFPLSHNSEAKSPMSSTGPIDDKHDVVDFPQSSVSPPTSTIATFVTSADDNMNKPTSSPPYTENDPFSITTSLQEPSLSGNSFGLASDGNDSHSEDESETEQHITETFRNMSISKHLSNAHSHHSHAQSRALSHSFVSQYHKNGDTSIFSSGIGIGIPDSAETDSFPGGNAPSRHPTANPLIIAGSPVKGIEEDDDNGQSCRPAIDLRNNPDNDSYHTAHIIQKPHSPTSASFSSPVHTTPNPSPSPFGAAHTSEETSKSGPASFVLAPHPDSQKSSSPINSRNSHSPESPLSGLNFPGSGSIAANAVPPAPQVTYLHNIPPKSGFGHAHPHSSHIPGGNSGIPNPDGYYPKRTVYNNSITHQYRDALFQTQLPCTVADSKVAILRRDLQNSCVNFIKDGGDLLGALNGAYDLGFSDLFSGLLNVVSGGISLYRMWRRFKTVVEKTIEEKSKAKKLLQQKEMLSISVLAATEFNHQHAIMHPPVLPHTDSSSPNGGSSEPHSDASTGADGRSLQGQGPMGREDDADSRHAKTHDASSPQSLGQPDHVRTNSRVNQLERIMESNE